MPFERTLVHIAAYLRQGGFATQQTVRRGMVLQHILIALLSTAVAGCDRRSDAPVSSRNAQLEDRQAELQVQNIASTDRRGDQVSVTVPPAATQVSKLPIYELKMDPKDLRTLEGNPGSNETHPATFIAEGQVYTNAQVRFRGEWARS